LKRIVLLGIGHRTRFKPAVKYIADASHGALPVGTWPGKIIDEVLVQVVHFLAALGLELCDTADDFDMVAAVALPDRNRISPETVAADCPVTGAFEPFAESAVLEMLRHPGDLVVGTEHILFDLVDVYEPTAHGAVDQRLL